MAEAGAKGTRASEMSMRKTSTYGLGLDQMAVLFSLGRADPNPAEQKSGNADMGSFLREQLACVLPNGSIFCDVLVMMIRGMGYDTRRLAGRSFGEVLLSPQSDVQLLQVVKDCSKVMSSALDSKAEATLATTIYYASLANVLVHHDRKITQHSYETLDESFKLLIEKKWMAQGLTELFAQARGICLSRRSEP